MRAFFARLLDIILPRKERVLRLDSYSIADFSVSPSQHEVHDISITTLLSYKTRAVEDVIRALKYDRFGGAAALLAEALAEYLREEIAEKKVFSSQPIVLVPVPLHASRTFERGFNQVERILKALPSEFRDGTLSRIETKTLRRTRATPQQTRLSRAERLRNVAGAFAAEGEALCDSHVILIDDVTTTGATLAEATRPLKGRAASLTLLALAHA